MCLPWTEIPLEILTLFFFYRLLPLLPLPVFVSVLSITGCWRKLHVVMEPSRGEVAEGEIDNGGLPFMF